MDKCGNAVLQDDPATSRFRAPPRFVSGGGGLVGTAADYLKFCHMLLNGGAANGCRFLAPKTLQLMTMNYLPAGRELVELSRSLYSEAIYAGLGFGLGFAVAIDKAKTMTAGNVGEYFWGGAASTAFWIDPKDELAVVFLTQLIPSSAWPIRQQLRTLVYAAMESMRAGVCRAQALVRLRRINRPDALPSSSYETIWEAGRKRGRSCEQGRCWTR